MPLFEYLVLRALSFLPLIPSVYQGCHMVPVHNCVSHDQAGLELSCPGLLVGSGMIWWPWLNQSAFSLGIQNLDNESTLLLSLPFSPCIVGPETQKRNRKLSRGERRNQVLWAWQGEELQGRMQEIPLAWAPESPRGSPCSGLTRLHWRVTAGSCLVSLRSLPFVTTYCAWL